MCFNLYPVLLFVLQNAAVMINGVQDPPISVTNTPSSAQTASYAYLSGCRVSGLQISKSTQELLGSVKLIFELLFVY